MNRLTDDRTAEGIKRICDGRLAEGVNPETIKSDLRYVKLAEYEQTGLEPSEIKQTGWISVKERMPEERDWYLGIFEDEFGTKTIPIVCDYVGCVAPSTTDEGWILSNITGNMEIQNVHEYYKHLKCLYWTYLPEPPKEVQDDA